MDRRQHPERRHFVLKAKAKARQEIKCFAAFDDRGNVLYATIRPTKDEAAALLRRFNPPVEGYAYPFQVLPVAIALDVGHQFNIEDAIEELRTPRHK